MPAIKKPAKAGPGKPAAPHATMKPVRTSARKKIPPFLIWFSMTAGRKTGMAYGPLKSNGGGGTKAWTHVRVRDFLDKDSDAVSTLPPAIVDARVAYPQYSFKAGHLINATLRGPGNDSKNLTILTASANSRHKGFDNKVKEALRLLQKGYQKLWKMGLAATDAALSIEVVVKTEGSWGVGMPDEVICANLRCKARLIDRAVVDAAIALLLPPPDPKLLAEYNSFVDRAEIALATALRVVPNDR